MKEKIKYLINKKSFHICMVIVIVAVILFGLGLIILKYNVEGETNMPFKLGKIRIVSSSEGVDKDPGENKWSFDINQNNDFYIYIERNNKYNKQEAIKSIVIDNINVQKNQEKGVINFYRPNITEQGGIFNQRDLLKKSGVSEDELKATITFDLTIKTESGKEYKSNLSFDMPVEGVVENGTAAKEITDLSNIIFKRTKN